MTEELEECRRRLPFPELLRRLGLGKSVGPNADGTGSAHCPHAERHKHGDENKSFALKLNPRTGRYFGKCFAGCGVFDDCEFLKRRFNLATFGDALEKYRELAGVNSAEALPDWDGCIAALSDAKLKEIAAWRGFSLEFLSRFKKQRCIGWYKGCVAFPVCDNTGKLVAIHCCRPRSKKWFYEPKGKEAWPFIIGEVAGPEHVIVAESTWDGLAYLDKSGETGGVIISRGKEFGRRTALALEPGKIVYALMQHDKECEHWLQELCAPGKLTVKAVRVPEKFNGVEKIHDLNDWLRAGCSAEDLLRAWMAAEIVATPTFHSNGESPADVGEMDFKAERTEEPEPEKSARGPFPIDRLPPILANAARAISWLSRVPLELAGTMVIAVTAMAIGKGLRVKSGPNRFTYANTYWLLSKSSGSGGSQCYEKAFEPFDAFQQTLKKDFERETEPRRLAELAAVAVRIKEITKELKEIKGDHDAEKQCISDLAALNRKKLGLEKIKSPTLYINDVTPESLVDQMELNGGTMAHVDSDAADALNIIIGDRYAKQSSKESKAETVWLKAYTVEDITIARKSGGGDPHHAQKPCLTCLFIVTPDYVEDLFSRVRLSSGGLLPRFLVCNSAVLPQREDLDVPDDAETPERSKAFHDLAVYRDMIFALGNRYHRYRVTKAWHDEELANPAPLCLDEDNDVEPYCVPMEIDAQRSRKIDHNLLCDLCESDGRNRPYESRHNENAIRLALDGQFVPCHSGKSRKGKSRCRRP